MNLALFEYYYAIRFAILGLILICFAGAIAFWLVRRRWLRQQKLLEQALADCQNVNLEKPQGILQSQVSHEYGKGLAYILNKSAETLDGLGSDQAALREKQSEIIAVAESLNQHASNILAVNSPRANILAKELLDIRQLVESVLLELFRYSESQGVTLRTNLRDFEPVFLDPGLTALAVRNLVHNAIKYSARGRVVEIGLAGEGDITQAGKAIVLTVKDHGRGIPKAEQEELFTLNWRGDGLVETGSGLGLYLSRRAARLQGGDVILVNSIPNEGSVFKLSLPVANAGEAAPEADEGVNKAQPKRIAVRWGLAIASLLVTSVLLFFLFRPPQSMRLITGHENFGERYISALGEQSGWELTQVQSPDACTQFHLIQRGDRVALLTCHGRFVSAPSQANYDQVVTQHDPLWKLGQAAKLGDCSLFEMIDLQDDPEKPGDFVAFQTCANMVITAGDGNWPGEMAWAVVAETDKINPWEVFRMVSPKYTIKVGE